jgi:acyl-coenzyme A thioesterase PaaI-like protein
MSEGTVTLNVQFIEPARGLLLAEGRLLRAGRTVAFVEGEVRNQSGAIVAKATATFKIERRRKPASSS